MLLEHPLAFVTVYVIKEDPADTPVITPDEFIVATPVFPLDQEVLLHEPVELNVVVDDTQTLAVPVIAATAGKEFTVTVVAVDVALQPLELVTVTLYEPLVVTVILCVVAPVLHVYE